MKRWLTENLGWKLLSLAVAVALWLTFVNHPELVTSISVPIEYANVPADLEVTPESPERVRLEVRGPSHRIHQFETSSPAVVLDLKGIHKPCERTFRITSEHVKLPPGLTLVRAVPAQVRLKLERRVERRIPVRPHVVVPLGGFEIVSQVVEPAELPVVGPESRVRAVEVVETDPVELSPTAGEQTVSTQAFLRDPELRLAWNGGVTVRVKLVQRRPSSSPEGLRE